MITLQQFITAGNATFTISNSKTGNRLTFRVKQPKREEIKGLRFVQVMTGPDNESSYTNLGTIFPDGRYFRSRKSRIGEDALSAKTFAFLWKYVDSIGKLPTIEIRYSNNCGRCGRKLTVPSSIDNRIGPECAKHFHI